VSRLEPPEASRVEAYVRAALDEDAAHADATTAYLDLGTRVVEAEIRAGAPLVCSGIEVARAVFREVDPSCRFDARAADGDALPAPGPLCRLHGRASSIVSAERCALNFLQRMCGIATHASRFVQAVEGTGVVILDTRKTTPLWRELEKYAVRCGGAQNHRRDLRSMVLIKDNHVRAMGGREALLGHLARAPRPAFVEVEVDSIEFLRALVASPVDRIMLDNFTPAMVAQAMEVVRAFRAGRREARPEIEVSGGVTLENVSSYAQPGVDFISVGALTHSAPAASMSLEVL
jgi:nicotinate-nucleotide pyrophosphorylase (carboxylating)